MTRFYAHIRKVSSPEFKIKLRWLEAHPEDQKDRAWVRADLPVGCGKFRRGSSNILLIDLYFLIKCSAKRTREVCTLYIPGKGKYGPFSIHWSSDSKSYRKYKYEIVEVLFDFVGDTGIQVGYLERVAGFISIFQ